MSLIDTLCKGGWDIIDKQTDERFSYTCHLRKTCLRYIARNSVAMVPFFDVVPIKPIIDANPTITESEIKCQYYQKWN